MLHRFMLAAVLVVSTPIWTAGAETDAERKACQEDAQTHCADEIPDRERVYYCLVQKVTLLSPACKKIISDSIAPAKPQRKR
jgi:hypothetical protein